MVRAFVNASQPGTDKGLSVVSNVNSVINSLIIACEVISNIRTVRYVQNFIKY